MIRQFKCFICTILLLQNYCSFAQGISFTKTDQSEKSAITTVVKAVVFLTNGQRCGTGFFVVRNENLYLVTAGHVAEFLDQKSKLYIIQDNDRPQGLFLSELTSKINWQYHPVVDLAVLTLDPSDFVLQKYLTHNFMPFGNIYLEKKSIPRDIQLTAIGFPFCLGVQEYFSPLTFKSFVSSGYITLPGKQSKPNYTVFFLENPVAQGYSGGPVYDLGEVGVSGAEASLKIVGGTIRMVGVITATLSDATGGKLAEIVPAFYLDDLIK